MPTKSDKKEAAVSACLVCLLLVVAGSAFLGLYLGNQVKGMESPLSMYKGDDDVPAPEPTPSAPGPPPCTGSRDFIGYTIDHSAHMVIQFAINYYRDPSVGYSPNGDAWKGGGPWIRDMQTGEKVVEMTHINGGKLCYIDEMGAGGALYFLDSAFIAAYRTGNGTYNCQALVNWHYFSLPCGEYEIRAPPVVQAALSTTEGEVLDRPSYPMAAFAHGADAGGLYFCPECAHRRRG